MYAVTWYESQWGLWTVDYPQDGGHWQKVLDLTRRISYPQTSGCKIRALIVQLVLPPTPTSIEDLLCSFQASVELDRVELRVLKLLMPETFLVCVLL